MKYYLPMHLFFGFFTFHFRTALLLNPLIEIMINGYRTAAFEEMHLLQCQNSEEALISLNYIWLHTTFVRTFIRSFIAFIVRWISFIVRWPHTRIYNRYLSYDRVKALYYNTRLERLKFIILGFQSILIRGS